MLGRTVGDLEDLLVLGDLGQGSLEPIGVSGELDRRRIGEVLALAVDGQLDEAGGDRRNVSPPDAGAATGVR